MIERWFPCAEVSAASDKGWGSGSAETSLFTWFAARPTAQAKAALICSLLPWPAEETEQKRLQDLVREAMTGRYAAWSSLREEIIRANPDGASVLDPFSGRGMVPLESARLGMPAAGSDYAPVAVLASTLLTDYPFRDWSTEPPLPFAADFQNLSEHRLVNDVERVLTEVGRRHVAVIGDFYPTHAGVQPWGYLWSVTLPCVECENRFPVFGSAELRKGSTRGGRRGARVVDPGQSFYVEGDRSTGQYTVVLHEGQPLRPPTLVAAVGKNGKDIPGKSAVCVFCRHTHPLALHRAMTNSGKGEDALLIVGDLHESYGKVFRLPTDDELQAAAKARDALGSEPRFTPVLPALPGEEIGPGNNNIIGPSIYGAKTYGDFMCDRQSLSFIRLSRVISDLGAELAHAGLSRDYSRALTGYAAANMVRMLRYSTRCAWLRARDKGTVEVAGIFVNEGSLVFSYDFFEAGPGAGPGTWQSVQKSSIATLWDLVPDLPGRPVAVERATAVHLPHATASWNAVVTDPPYDKMVAYTDSSDLLYCWLKRALITTWPELAVTADPTGAQEKEDEIIVKRVRGVAKSTFRDHRTQEHYDRKITEAFSEMRRVTKDDGIVTIVFGHGDPEVWERLLRSIEKAGLVMTASWPANTESGGQQGKANIKTTLTMACRPAPTGRGPGRKGAVEAEIRAAIHERFPEWERWGLAPADMLMAAAGPAMEVVGRYSEVQNARGAPVDIHTFLPLARSAVQEAMAVEIDDHPLATFDARTSFALWWVRLYCRQVQAKSELRWQALAASMELADVRDLVPDADKGVKFVTAKAHNARITNEASVIDVALALAAASEEGLAAMGEVVAASGRDPQDAFLWAAVKFLADRLPDADPDSIAFNRVLRTRDGIASAAQTAAAGEHQAHRRRRAENAQQRLL
jgi:adenine-specific DNA methylase